MLINIGSNNKILKDAIEIQLSDFTILTGENGSGKTQLLQFIRDFGSMGFVPINQSASLQLDSYGWMPLFPLLTDDRVPLKDIIYSYPGLRNNLYEQQLYQQSLIQIIKSKWNELSQVVIAYTLIKHKSFLSEDVELVALNQAFSAFIISSTERDSYNPHIEPKAKQVTLGQLHQLKRLSELTGKVISELNIIDFIIFYQIPLELFSAALDLLFHQFNLKRKYHEHLTEGITPPWDVFNEILNNANFKYKAEYNESYDEDLPGTVKLVDKKTNSQVEFESLSSGETTIMALIFALYNSSNNGHFPQVILFDEPDAHLHPSLTQVFLNVIKDVLVDRHQVKVILTTHSPSTVALAPDDSIYCMDRELGQPIKQEKRTAINILSNGLATMTIEESNLGITYNIRKANNNILFTEGVTDKIILDIAWKKLYPNKAMNFFIQDCFSASFLGTLFKQGDQPSDGIFNQFPDIKMIALFDFDSAGYSYWNIENKFPSIIEADPKKCLTRFNHKNGFMMLLPVPEIPEIYKQVIKNGNETYKDQSILTIESLFFHMSELRYLFKEQALPGEGTAYEIKGAKSKQFLVNKASQFTSDAFKYFQPIFEKIESILNM
jgi:ABC-type cobalamin/Fe3+-siderophores transport system ATPase subunit